LALPRTFDPDLHLLADGVRVDTTWRHPEAATPQRLRNPLPRLGNIAAQSEPLGGDFGLLF
jgi:hypothetical protein